MFQISVETEFCAAHALVISGVREPTHGHNFHLTVIVQGDRLDADGLLVDFHALERLVHEIVRPFHNADMNAAPPFAGGKANPSAELIAKHIADRVSAGLAAITPPNAPTPRLASVRLTEAPGCGVIFTPT